MLAMIVKTKSFNNSQRLHICSIALAKLYVTSVFEYVDTILYTYINARNLTKTRIYVCSSVE